MKPIRTYIHDVGLSNRPEFYAGYGPTEGYFGVAHLTKIEAAMRADGGDAEADAMRRMLADLEIWSPSNLVAALHALAERDYVHTKPKRQPKVADHIADGMKDANGDYSNPSVGFAGLFTAMNAPDEDTQRWQTALMKHRYLGGEAPKQQRRMDMYGFY